MAAVLILNWNGWGDTIECLESVLRLDPAPARVVVCDNASANGSLDRILAWAEGRLCALAEDPAMAPHSRPPVAKPVPHVVHGRAAAEAGGAEADAGCRLTLIDTGANLGFAGGNNVGLRYLLARGEGERVWLLNNDTVVAPDALGHLVATLDAEPALGIVGATLLFYDRPEVIQIQGGSVYRRLTGVGRGLGRGRALADALARAEVEARMDYVAGAAMMVSGDFLRRVGLMGEAYFLYYEELDWVSRARGLFRLGYQPAARVYHKVGRSIGSSLGKTRRSLLSEYYLRRNRIRLTARYWPLLLPGPVLANLASAARHALAGRGARAGVILRATLGRPLPKNVP